MAVLNALRQQNFRWQIIPLLIVILVFTQFWVRDHIRARTLDLRRSLDSNYIVALELTRVLGYGGLIHHFKNFLLRPEELQYLEAGREAASVADLLVQDLENSAVSLGLEATLSNTRAMISGYRERLERIPMLADSGLSTQQMDTALRLDDQFAIQEIGNLLEQLSDSVLVQIEDIEVQGRMLSLVNLAGTIVLSILILTMFMQRRHRIAHMTSTDTLNRKLATSNSKLTEANTSLKQFAGIVSHDLQVPLRHISLFNGQILEDIDDREAVRSHVAAVQSSVVRMTDLISNLLGFTRTGFKHPESELIDIRPLIMDVVSEFQMTIDEKQANVTVQADGQVMADALLLRRVLQNLLDNSLKYTKDGQIPHVDIVAKHLDDQMAGTMRIMISDNGLGLPDEQAERCFEASQSQPTNQPQYSGIGLSLAKTVIDAHGGNIEIDNDYRGGTRICLTLPSQARRGTPDSDTEQPQRQRENLVGSRQREP